MAEVAKAPFRTGICWLTLGVACTAAAGMLWRSNDSIADENHILETSQAVLLLLACVIHGVRSGRSVSELDTWYRMGWALLCVSFAVREIDIDRLGSAPLWPNIELAIRAAVAIAWLLFIALLLPRVRRLWSGRREAFFSQCSLYAMLGGLLYLVSWVFDKELTALDADISRLVEEIIQLMATIAFFASATTPQLADEPEARTTTEP